jgi:hypothetical protein
MHQNQDNKNLDLNAQLRQFTKSNTRSEFKNSHQLATPYNNLLQTKRRMDLIEPRKFVNVGRAHISQQDKVLERSHK